jgi:hypothetical protein
MVTGISPDMLSALANAAIQISPPEPKAGGKGGAAPTGKDVYIRVAAAPKLHSSEGVARLKEEPDRQMIYFFAAKQDYADPVVRQELVGYLEKTDKFTLAAKMVFMEAVASFHNDSDITPEKKAGIVDLFKEVSKSSDSEAFNAGMHAIPLMEKVKPGIYKQYIETYATHAEKDTPIGKSPDVTKSLKKLAEHFAKNHSDVAGDTVYRLAEAWFNNPKKASLIHTVMAMSVVGGNTKIKIGSTEISKSMQSAVVDAFTTMYTSRHGDHANIAEWFTRQLDPANIKEDGTIVEDANGVPNVPITIAAAHEEIIDHVLSTIIKPRVQEDDRVKVEWKAYNQAIGRALLDGLVKNNVDQVRVSELNEKPIVKIYAKFRGNSVLRKRALEQAEKHGKKYGEKKGVHERVLKYLASKDKEGTTLPAHNWVRDRDPIDPKSENPVSPIRKWYTDVTPIVKIEDVCGTAKGDADIKKECIQTEDAVYQERDVITNSLALGAGVTGKILLDEDEITPFEKSVVSIGVNLKWYTPEVSDNLKVMIGANLATSSEILGLEAKGGVSMKLGEHLRLDIAGAVGYFKYEGVDDDLTVAAALKNADPAVAGNQRTIARPQIAVEGATFGASIGISAIFGTVHLGGGRTFQVGADINLMVGGFAATLTDLEPMWAMRMPDGTIVVLDIVDDKTATADLDSEVFMLDRDEGVSGILIQIDALLFLRFGGLF